MSTTSSEAVLITGCSTGIGAATAERLAPVAMDSVRRQFETNVFGLVRMCQLVLPGMRGQGWGKIVNLSSMGGKFTFPGGGFYHATKHAVESLSDALRFEVRGFGVDVIIIEPGLIRTEFGGTVASAIAENTVAENTVAGGPYSVAKAIEKAISARRPRTRYLVTASARARPLPHALLPDRAWDAFLRTQFSQPGKE